uniref:Uncharacterized protein n=1 Tax=Plectus sambesii TaxID=2011161 RepID=A0A914X4Q8_9BILA
MTKLLLLVTVTIAILATAAGQKSNLRCLDGSTPLGTCLNGLCPLEYQCSLGNICCGTGGSNTQTNVPVCTGNTVLIGTQCMAKTTDGACLNVNCLSTGNAGCANYAPYKKCGYNAGQNSYFCCQ